MGSTYLFRCNAQQRFQKGLFRAKLYQRHIYSFGLEEWSVSRDLALDAIEEQIRVAILSPRAVFIHEMLAALQATSLDVDDEAIIDLMRYACATGRLSLIPMMTQQGFLAEGFLANSFVEKLAPIRALIGNELEENGWLDNKRLQQLLPTSGPKIEPQLADSLLAFASAYGLGEYHRKGLFYRRPFILSVDG